jgi:hypothetical protein
MVRKARVKSQLSFKIRVETQEPQKLYIAPFLEAEAFAAVKTMNRNSAPGPDEFGLSFYMAGLGHS